MALAPSGGSTRSCSRWIPVSVRANVELQLDAGAPRHSSDGDGFPRLKAARLRPSLQAGT